MVVSFDIPLAHLPTFRSVLKRVRKQLSKQSTLRHNQNEDDALLRAIACLGTAFAAVNALTEDGDPYYDDACIRDAARNH